MARFDLETWHKRFDKKEWKKQIYELCAPAYNSVYPTTGWYALGPDSRLTGSRKTLYATSRIDAPNKTNLETDNSHFETRKPEKWSLKPEAFGRSSFTDSLSTEKLTIDIYYTDKNCLTFIIRILTSTVWQKTLKWVFITKKGLKIDK